MDSRFQSSFIPRKPVDTGSLRPSGDVNIFLILAVIIFIITGAASGGVFLYRASLEKTKQAKDTELVQARKAFGLDEIAVLKQRSQQLDIVKMVLTGHKSTRPIFSLIQENTLRSVRFKTFTFSNRDGRATLTLAGEARSFNAVAYQSKVFTEMSEFLSPVFSGFALEDSGAVKFNFTTEVRPDILSYAKTIETATPSAEDSSFDDTIR